LIDFETEANFMASYLHVNDNQDAGVIDAESHA
jgi:hypothetical protein